MKRVFSGAQPTGNMHLGNYLGAFRNWVKLQNDYECIYCVVDLHAITLFQDPKDLRENTRASAAAYIASGVDPEKSILFNQSRVPAHAELAWIFNCVVRLGWLNRMTQFKDKAGKDKEKSSAGLFVYPSLMAADILAYKATHVPVGEDQKQHLELTRDIAAKFNNDFGVDYFPMIEPVITGGATRVMSLRDGTKKMSKSELSPMTRIDLTDDVDVIAQKFKKAKTDAEPIPADPKELEARPEAKNLITIFAALSNQSIEDVCQKYAGQGFAGFKGDLTAIAVDQIGPVTSEMKRLLGDPKYLDGILTAGAEKAHALSNPILREVKEIVGFL